MNKTEGKGTVKWGILGCARIAANALIPGMMRSSNCEVSAIASRSRDKAEEFAWRWMEKIFPPKVISGVLGLMWMAEDMEGPGGIKGMAAGPGKWGPIHKCERAVTAKG